MNSSRKTVKLILILLTILLIHCHSENKYNGKAINYLGENWLAFKMEDAKRVSIALNELELQKNKVILLEIQLGIVEKVIKLTDRQRRKAKIMAVLIPIVSCIVTASIVAPTVYIYAKITP